MRQQVQAMGPGLGWLGLKGESEKGFPKLLFHPATQPSGAGGWGPKPCLDIEPCWWRLLICRRPKHRRTGKLRQAGAVGRGRTPAPEKPSTAADGSSPRPVLVGLRSVLPDRSGRFQVSTLRLCRLGLGAAHTPPGEVPSPPVLSCPDPAVS